MPSTCLLHNANICSKRRTIERAKADDEIRIVFGYDWGVVSDNDELIYKYVTAVAERIEQESTIKVSFRKLKGNDGSILCDICKQIRSADVAIFDVSSHNVNVAFELGLAIGAGAYVFVLRSKHQKPSKSSFSELNGILEYRFSRRLGVLKFATDFGRSLRTKLRKVVREKLSVQAAGEKTL